MSPRLLSAVVLAGMFLMGSVTGGAVVRLAGTRKVQAQLDAPPPIMRRKVFLTALDRAVELDDREFSEVQAILARHDPEVREMYRAFAPRATALRERTFDEVRSVLRPDQMPRFQRFVDRQEARARAVSEGAGPGAGPPLPTPREW